LKKFALSLALAVLSGTSAIASEYQAAMSAFVESTISGLAADPIVIEAISQQNAARSGFDMTNIVELEQQWSDQVASEAAPLVDEVVGNAASDFLRAQIEQSGGEITEIIIMDALGLNVAVSEKTTDIWQGDEPKFLETFPLGAGAVHYGEVEFDASTQSFQGQITMTVVDPGTGAAIGAITVAVNAEELL